MEPRSPGRSCPSALSVSRMDTFGSWVCQRAREEGDDQRAGGTGQLSMWGPLCVPGGSDGKASACNAGAPGSIPGSGRSPGEANGNPFQYSCLENPMDRGAWRSMGSQRVGHDRATSLFLRAQVLLVGGELRREEDLQRCWGRISGSTSAQPHRHQQSFLGVQQHLFGKGEMERCKLPPDGNQS